MAGLSDAVLAGVHMSEQGDLSARSQTDLWIECVKGALADANLTMHDVDGLIGIAPDGLGMRQTLPGGAVADLFGHPFRFHAATTCGASAQSSGVGLAAMAIAHGMAEVVIVPTATAGAAEGYLGADRGAAVRRMAQLGSPYEYVWGTTRVADYAFLARRHMHEFGTRPEQLAEIAVAERYGATLNPLSVMGSRGEITIDDVMSSRMVADPLKVLDCCLVNQGGGCIVVTSPARARDAAAHPPVVLAGWGQGHSYLDPHQPPDLTSFGGGRLAADTAFGMAGVTHDDIDVVATSDHFTINVLIELEAAGFCGRGEGGSFVEGQATRIGGRLPVNTDGGFLSSSHAANSGVYAMIELIRQLRGQAGPRQVEGAALAYIAGSGGVSSTQYSAILARA